MQLNSDQCRLLSSENMAASLDELASRLASLDVLEYSGMEPMEEYNAVHFDVFLRLLTASTSLRTLSMQTCSLQHCLYVNSPLEQQLMKTTSLTALSLQYNFAFSNIESLERVVSSTQSLRHLNLSCCKLGERDPDGAWLGRAMQVTTSIVELDLSHTGIEFCRGNEFLRSMLNSSSLHTLCLADSRPMNQLFGYVLCDSPGLNHVELIGFNMTTYAGNAWERLVEDNTVLQHLRMTLCNWKESSLEGVGLALAKNTALRLLDLGGSDLTREDFQAFGQGLRGNTTLRTLVLWPKYYDSDDEDSDDDDEPREYDTQDLLPVIKALAINKTLLHLKFCKYKMQDDAATALARALRSNTSMSLQYLDISYNEITHVGMTRLCKALATSTSLVVLDLGCFQDRRSVRAVCDLLKQNTRLQELKVESTVHTMDVTYCSYAASKIFQALRHNASLQSLSFYESADEYPTIWAELATLLRHNTCLNHLYFPWPEIHPKDALRHVIDALRDQPRYHPLSLKGMRLHQAVAHQDASREEDLNRAPWKKTRDKDEELLLRIRCAHQDKMTAFLMASHSRLGAESACTIFGCDCMRAIVLCYFGLPVDYVDQPPGRYREYERVLEAFNRGSDPIPGA